MSAIPGSWRPLVGVLPDGLMSGRRFRISFLAFQGHLETEGSNIISAAGIGADMATNPARRVSSGDPARHNTAAQQRQVWRVAMDIATRGDAMLPSLQGNGFSSRFPAGLSRPGRVQLQCPDLGSRSPWLVELQRQ